MPISTAQTIDTPARIKSIDGLRAIAALLVVVAHSFHPYFAETMRWAVNPGAVGVRLFFVLSGALISGLLWSMADGGTFGQTWRRFAYRRALRILPLAYVAMIACWLVMVPAMADKPVAHLTFTNNLQSAGDPSWPDGMWHFWTLAVEEQIYLIWPALVLLVPATRWPAVALALGASAFAARLALPAWNHAPFWYLDSFSAGSLIAWSVRHGDLSQFTRWCAWIGAGFVAVTWWTDDAVTNSALETGLVLITAALVGWTWQRPTHPLLSSAPLVWIGAMSYGVYVWHEAGPRILYQLGLPYDAEGVDVLALKMACGLGLAALTWYGFEKPINRLKDGRRVSADAPDAYTLDPTPPTAPNQAPRTSAWSARRSA